MRIPDESPTLLLIGGCNDSAPLKRRSTQPRAEPPLRLIQQMNHAATRDLAYRILYFIAANTLRNI